MNHKNKKIFENKSILIWKMAIASALSWELAKLLGSNHPYLAPLAVILCIRPMINQTILFSIHRFIGTIIGIIIVVTLASHLHVNGWTLGILILVGSFVTKWLKLNETAIEQVALTILLVFALEHKAHHYAFDRIKDTLIGAVLAIMISVYIYPSFFTKRAAATCDEYSNHLAEFFLEFAHWIQSGCNQIKGQQFHHQLKKHLQELQQIKKDINKTAKVFNHLPYIKKKGAILGGYQKKTKSISTGYSYLLNVAPTFIEWGSSGWMTSSDKALWANQMNMFSEKWKNSQQPMHDPFLQGNLLITIPIDQQQHQYNVALYQETTQFIKKQGKEV